jgi:hypothetical protein
MLATGRRHAGRDARGARPGRGRHLLQALERPLLHGHFTLEDLDLARELLE